MYYGVHMMHTAFHWRGVWLGYLAALLSQIRESQACGVNEHEEEEKARGDITPPGLCDITSLSHECCQMTQKRKQSDAWNEIALPRRSILADFVLVGRWKRQIKFAYKYASAK